MSRLLRCLPRAAARRCLRPQLLRRAYSTEPLPNLLSDLSPPSQQSTPGPTTTTTTTTTTPPSARQDGAAPPAPAPAGTSFKLGLEDGHLVMTWPQTDGTEKRQQLSAPFLRDMCQCPKCVDPASGQKKFSTASVSPDVRIRSAQNLNEGEYVVLTWENDAVHGDEVTVLHRGAVRMLLRQRSRKLNFADWPEQSWDASRMRRLFESYLTMDFGDWMTTSWKKVDRNLNLLSRFGLLRITGVPERELSVSQLAAQVGTPMSTFYGETWDVRTKPQAENVAYTSGYLGLHQDLLYLQRPPRLQFLHCLRNSCEGGESMFADGHRQLYTFARANRDLYSLLKTTHQTFGYSRDGHRYRKSWPVFMTEGGRAKVRWSPPFQLNFNSAWASTSDFGPRLAALRAWEEHLNSDIAVFRYRMRPGEAVIFDNHRVLHGRAAFDPSTGSRWLRGTYLGEAEWRAALHLLDSWDGVKGLPRDWIKQLYGAMPRDRGLDLGDSRWRDALEEHLQEERERKMRRKVQTELEARGESQPGSQPGSQPETEEP